MTEHNPHSTAKIADHPLHPMIVPFPIAFFVSTLATDLVFLRTANPGWAQASMWLLGAGLAMSLLAAVLGLTDFLGERRVRRIREAWLIDRDNDRAIVHGLSASARVITAAAAIMFAVFGSFVAGDSAEIKMFGLGLAVAVLLDATVIRMLVVPASMKVLGNANWWIPAWLDRLLPNLDIEGSEATEELEPAPASPPKPTETTTA